MIFLVQSKLKKTDLVSKNDSKNMILLPAIGRWHVNDPMAVITPNWTPYKYGLNKSNKCL